MLLKIVLTIKIFCTHLSGRLDVGNKNVALEVLVSRC